MLVEKVESGRGEGGPDDMMVACPAGAVPTGLRVGTLSLAGTGRLRLRMAAAAGTGVWDMGSAGGGDGGGECW